MNRKHILAWRYGCDTTTPPPRPRSKPTISKCCGINCPSCNTLMHRPMMSHNRDVHMPSSMAGGTLPRRYAPLPTAPPQVASIKDSNVASTAPSPRGRLSSRRQRPPASPLDLGSRSGAPPSSRASAASRRPVWTAAAPHRRVSKMKQQSELTDGNTADRASHSNCRHTSGAARTLTRRTRHGGAVGTDRRHSASPPARPPAPPLVVVAGEQTPGGGTPDTYPDFPHTCRGGAWHPGHDAAGGRVPRRCRRRSRGGASRWGRRANRQSRVGGAAVGGALCSHSVFLLCPDVQAGRVTDERLQLFDAAPTWQSTNQITPSRSHFVVAQDSPPLVWRRPSWAPAPVRLVV